MSIDWDAFRTNVHRHQRFLLTSHIKPDCDALGSELGMALALEAIGKQVRIVNADATPSHLQFIDPQNRIEALTPEIASEISTGFDAILILDTSAWIQLGEMAEVVRGFDGLRMVVDHHVSQDDLGAETYKNVESEAAGCLVLEAADALGVQLTAEMAIPLFAAVATDTGWFRFASTTANTYRTVARLVEAGAAPQAIYTALYENDSLARVRLRGHVLAGAQTELDGRLAYAAARQSDFATCRAELSDTEDVINEILAVVGTEVALLFVELPEQRVKVSFRSRGEIDVRAVAAQFGGGGHRVAAGATLSSDFESAHARVLQAVREVFRP